MKQLKPALCLLLGFVVSGCEIIGSAGPQQVGDFKCGEYAICTDKLEYNSVIPAGNRYQLVIRYENRESVPVYLDRCNLDTKIPVFGFEYVEDDSTGSAFNRGWGCVAGIANFLVLPGESRVDTLTVFPSVFSHGAPWGAVSGAHRLYYEKILCCGQGDGSLSRVYSNIFTLH
ncbi:MAG: hypothetical protein AAF564_07855 [Bacteroidota bacterium]